ncbi:hypothetical protein Tco_0238202 [Tanacetum coccineum]
MQLVAMRLPSTQGISKSQPLPERKPTDPEDSERITQLAKNGIAFHSGKTSSEVEPNFNPPAIRTFADFQSLLEDSEKELKGFTEDLWEKHEEAAASYADLKAKIEGFHDQVYDAQDNTGKSISHFMNLLERIKKYDTQQFTTILNNLSSVQEALKEDLALNATSGSLKTDSSDIKEPPSQPEGEQEPMVIGENQPEEPEATKATPIQTVIPIPITTTTSTTPITNEVITKTITPEVIITTITPEVPLTESSSRPTLTDPVPEVTPPEHQAGSLSFITPKADKGKGIARETNTSPPKLVRDSRQVCQDPDAHVLINYMIVGKMVQITGDELQAIMDKKKQMKHAAKNVELSKPKIIKVVEEVANEAGVKFSGGKDFVKHQDAHLKLRPVAIIAYKDNDIRNFEYHKEFKFGDFGPSEWDELGVIIPTKKNQCMGELMNSLSKKYERLKKIAKSFRINKSLPLPEQDPSLPSNRKIKAIELEPDCLKPILMVCIAIRVSDIYKVETETPLGYKMMALNVKLAENQRFIILMNKMIDERPDKDKPHTKKVKLEALGYTDV